MITMSITDGIYLSFCGCNACPGLLCVYLVLVHSNCGLGFSNKMSYILSVCIGAFLGSLTTQGCKHPRWYPGPLTPQGCLVTSVPGVIGGLSAARRAIGMCFLPEGVGVWPTEPLGQYLWQVATHCSLGGLMPHPR